MQKAYSLVTSNYVVASFALIVAFLLVVATASPALAHGRYNGGDVRVSNNNSAYVGNIVIVGANTGYNTADGGDGDNGGDGGDANNGGEAGNGGSGGDGGEGGDIDTGDAIATALVDNDVNSNRTVVDSCGCEGRKSRDNGDVRVSNNNSAKVHNTVVVGANTGGNVANGGDGDNGGDGGDANNNNRKRGSYKSWGNWGNNNSSEAGNGGSGGDGGEGGDIDTGDADSLAQVVNVVNRSVTRVQR